MILFNNKIVIINFIELNTVNDLFIYMKSKNNLKKYFLFRFIDRMFINSII